MNKLRLALTLLGFAALSACGGGGDSPAPPPPGPPPPAASYVRLASDAGDYVGGGNNYAYSQADANFTITVQGGHLSVAVAGDESWQGDFQLPNTYASLQAGVYTGLTFYPFNDAAIGGLSWSGQGRSCSTLTTGSVTITKAVYTGAALSEVSLTFTQYCNGSSAALHGEVYWNANDTSDNAAPV